MKNCFLLKFIAVLLCAASLMGVLGGTAGALILADGDLYHKSVDEAVAQRIQALVSESATQLANRYGDQVLGGCPSDISRYPHGNPMDWNFISYGYAIVDKDGTVLESLNPELKDSTQTHRIPVTGQYMHLVSLQTESQLREEAAKKKMDVYRNVMTDTDGVAVPVEGISTNHVIFTDRDGHVLYEANCNGLTGSSTYFYREYLLDNGVVESFANSYDHQSSSTGFLFYNADHQLAYTSFLKEQEKPFQATVYGVFFRNADQHFTFQTENDEGLGTLSNETGYLLFTSFAVAPEPVPEETVEDTLPSETAEETAATELPQETESSTEATESTAAEETGAATEETSAESEEASSASAVPEETTAEKAASKAAASGERNPVLINGKSLENYQINQTEYYSHSSGERIVAKYVYLPLPELTVEIYAGPETMRDAFSFDALRVLRYNRDSLLPIIGVSLVLLILSAVYLCRTAGRQPKTEEIRAGGLNRLPLDLYLFLAVLIITGMIALACVGVPLLLASNLAIGCSLAFNTAFVCCLILTGFFYATVAQIKTGSGMWWRNTLSVRFIFLFMRYAEKLRVRLFERGFPRLIRVTKTLWSMIWKLLVRIYELIEKFTADTGAKLNRYFSLMPLTWQWVVSGMLLFCLVLIACNTHSELMTFLCLAASMALIFYGCHCFGVLLESTRKMGKGNLNTKVEDRFMVGCFRDFANDLNDLANVAMVAAQKQLKSERMKTELITNVSHDIKTPLTSIINYVDLLQKPHTDAEGQQYLEVLDRQSLRLKKLVDDLMDMSKASTGNMAVEITRVDMVEAVNQALGEFSDKLDRAQLFPVFRHSEASVPIMADGKLVWRVLSNILSNAVKYAMPRTRIYLDLTHVHGQVILSLKNISREELNVTAEELMERFVRGDVSRNTEGSGLGLNIAKSLMELQKGQLQILVDGDLFKVTLIFPDAK